MFLSGYGMFDLYKMNVGLCWFSKTVDCQGWYGVLNFINLHKNNINVNQNFVIVTRVVPLSLFLQINKQKELN